MVRPLGAGLIDKKLPDYEKTYILGRGSYIDMFKIKVRATHPGNSWLSTQNLIVIDNF